MPAAALIPLFILIAAAAAGGAYHAVVLWRLVRAARTLPTARDGLALPPPEGGWPTVCIVVPAHNEEAVIADLARSIAAQDYPRLRAVFSLDRCTDGTRRALEHAWRDAGAPADAIEIIEVDRCPDGWAGKPHAAWRGVRGSAAAHDADLLLFADADTRFHPGLVRASVALLHSRRLDLLSLLSELARESWFEKVVQPAAGFELIRQYPLDIVNREERPRAFANGQFMLFRRALYDAVGGHERVRDELLEDIAFARYLSRNRHATPARWGVYLSAGLLRCRMYRDWPAFKRGWKRIYMEAAARRAGQLTELAWRTRLVGTALPLAALLCALAGVVVLALGHLPVAAAMIAVGGAACAVSWATLTRIYADQGAPRAWAILYPAGAWLTASILAEAARDLRTRTPVQWGGRSYVREASA